MNLDYLYIGLFKNTELGLVEIPQENTNYCRIEMCPFDWVLVKNYVVTNVHDVRFNETINEWGLVTHFGIFDSLQGGNLLMIVSLDLGRETNIHKGIQIQFEAGKLAINIKELRQEIENG